MNDRPPVINIDVPKQPRPVINIDMPKALPPVISVNVPKQDAPIVNVQAHKHPKAWVFDVEYNGQGRISIVTATPKF